MEVLYCLPLCSKYFRTYRATKGTTGKPGRSSKSPAKSEVRMTICRALPADLHRATVRCGLSTSQLLTCQAKEQFHHSAFSPCGCPG